MAALVRTHEFRRKQSNYSVHPKFTATMRAVEKSLMRDSWIHGTLSTFSGIISSIDKFFDDTGHVADFERLYFNTGLFTQCTEEKRYYYDHEVAATLKQLAIDGKRLPAYEGDPAAQLAMLKQKLAQRPPTPRLRDQILHLVPRTVPVLVEAAPAEQATETVDEVATPSEERRISEPPPKSEPPRAPALADALVAIELIESEGVHKGVYVVDQNLIAEIKSVLLALQEMPAVDPALITAESKLQSAIGEISALKTELLTASATNNAAEAQVVALTQANAALQDEVVAAKAQAKQDAESILTELKSLPGLLARAAMIVAPHLPESPAEPLMAIAEAQPFALATALQQRLDTAQSEHDELKKLFDGRNHTVQEYADQLDDLATRLQQNFALTPDQINETHLKKSSEVRALHAAWNEIRAKITDLRRRYELESLEDRLAQMATSIRALKVVLRDAASKA